MVPLSLLGLTFQSFQPVFDTVFNQLSCRIPFAESVPTPHVSGNQTYWGRQLGVPRERPPLVTVWVWLVSQYEAWRPVWLVKVVESFELFSDDIYKSSRLQGFREMHFRVGYPNWTSFNDQRVPVCLQSLGLVIVSLICKLAKGMNGIQEHVVLEEIFMDPPTICSWLPPFMCCHPRTSEHKWFGILWAPTLFPSALYVHKIWEWTKRSPFSCQWPLISSPSKKTHSYRWITK